MDPHTHTHKRSKIQNLSMSSHSAQQPKPTPFLFLLSILLLQLLMRKRKLHSLSFEPPPQQAEAEPKTKDPCGLKRAEHHDTSGPLSCLCNFQHIRGREFDFKQVPPHSPSRESSGLSGLNLECGRRIDKNIVSDRKGWRQKKKKFLWRRIFCIFFGLTWISLLIKKIINDFRSV